MSTEPEAGPKLDAMIHDVVFGQKVYTQEEMRRIGAFPFSYPPYSSESSAAIPVLKELRLALLPLDGGWAAGRFTDSGSIGPDPKAGAVYIDDDLRECGIADTIPLAICRAALKVRAAQKPAIEPVPASAPKKAEYGSFGFACGRVPGK